jgi:predicted transposase/invertase (TIGR01784 family)
VLSVLDLDSIEITKDSFIDEDMRESFSDLLYKVQMAGYTGFVYILFEHKSFADRYTAFQLLKYMLRIWELHHRQSPKHELPAILPLVIYQGVGPWRLGVRFRDLLAPEQEALFPYLPDYRFILYDLSHLSDEEIRGGIITRVMLLAMKHIFNNDLSGKLPEILSLLNDLADKKKGLECLETLFKYIVHATDKLTKEDFNNALSSIPEGEQIMPTLAQQWFQEGLQEGLQKGKQEGLQEGLQEGEQQGRLFAAREMILELIEARFGMPPQSLAEKLRLIRSYEVLRLLRRQIENCRTTAEFEQLVEKAL